MSVYSSLLHNYIRGLANALCLCDWTIRLRDEPAVHGRAAEVSPVWGRKHADLRLGCDWDKLDKESQREALVHEMIELHHAHLRAIIGEGTKRGWHRALEHQIELTIDGLADAVKQFFSLPPAPFDNSQRDALEEAASLTVDSLS